MTKLFRRLVLAAGILTLAMLAVAPAGDRIPKAGAKAVKKHPRGHKTPSAEVLAARHAAAFKRHDHRMKHLPTAAPDKFDCRTMGWVGPVRDQGNCGSCWDVSGCDCITSAFIKAGLAKNDGSFEISPQFLLDGCGYRNAGCGGDDSINVLDWAKSHGIPSEADYGPYTAGEGRCRFNSQKLYKIADWGYCTPSQQSGIADPQDVINAMVQYGPISSGVAADGLWDSVTADGVIPYRKLSVGDVNHDIQIVGVDKTKVIPGAPAPGAYLIKNQWGTGWGANGYAWLSFYSHAIGSEAAWAVVTPLPPPPPPTPPTPPTPPVPPTPPAPPQPATVTIPDLPVTLEGVHVPGMFVRGGTFTVASGKAGGKSVSWDVLAALLKLAQDIHASGQGKLIADLKAVEAAIFSRSGILAAMEQLGADLIAVGSDPSVLADLLRIATDLGVNVPQGSVLRTGKPCCGK